MNTKKRTKFIIVEDNPNFLVVDKPVDISIQDEVEEPGLISLLKLQAGIDALHPVHRLDRVTSGLLIVAKNSVANRELSSAFEKRQVEKYYLAVSRTKRGSEAKKKQGKIVGDMRPARNGSWMLARTKKHQRSRSFLARVWAIGIGYLFLSLRQEKHIKYELHLNRYLCRSQAISGTGARSQTELIYMLLK